MQHAPRPRRSRQVRSKRPRAIERVSYRAEGGPLPREQSKADRTQHYNDRRTIESWCLG